MVPFSVPVFVAFFHTYYVIKKFDRLNLFEKKRIIKPSRLSMRHTPKSNDVLGVKQENKHQLDAANKEIARSLVTSL